MLIHQARLFHNTGIDTSRIVTKQYPANYTIELEGSICSNVFIVLTGALGITSYNASGTSIHLQKLDEGMMVGDVLLFGSNDHRYPGNVLALSASTIAVLPYQTILDYFHNNTQFRLNLLALISGKAYQSALETKLLSQDSLRDKLLHYINRESVRQKTQRIQLNMTKEELAKKLHVKRPSLSRELALMKQEGLIDYNRWTITIKK